MLQENEQSVKHRGKRPYSESYKRKAVAKAQASGNVSQIMCELGISNKCLHDWIRRNGHWIVIHPCVRSAISFSESRID